MCTKGRGEWRFMDRSIWPLSVCVGVVGLPGETHSSSNNHKIVNNSVFKLKRGNRE